MNSIEMLTRLQYTCFVKAEKISIISRSKPLSACDKLFLVTQQLPVIIIYPVHTLPLQDSF